MLLIPWRISHYTEICEGCESKKCKISVVCAHAHAWGGCLKAFLTVDASARWEKFVGDAAVSSSASKKTPMFLGKSPTFFEKTPTFTGESPMLFFSPLNWGVSHPRFRRKHGWNFSESCFCDAIEQPMWGHCFTKFRLPLSPYFWLSIRTWEGRGGHKIWKAGRHASKTTDKVVVTCVFTRCACYGS